MFSETNNKDVCNIICTLHSFHSLSLGIYLNKAMWYDQPKSVVCWSRSIFCFTFYWLSHFQSLILAKILSSDQQPLKTMKFWNWNKLALLRCELTYELMGQSFSLTPSCTHLCQDEYVIISHFYSKNMVSKL